MTGVCFSCTIHHGGHHYGESRNRKKKPLTKIEIVAATEMSKAEREKIEKQYDGNQEKLRKELPRVLKCANAIPGLFRGPSIYFHHKALLESKERFLSPEHLETIYAVLPSWGMHRMGGDAKVCSFNEFKTSILDSSENEETINDLKTIDDYLSKIENTKKRNVATIEKLGEKVSKIAKLISQIKASSSDSHLVSASKTLHHILPNLVPPIDREYSVRFMKKECPFVTGQKNQVNVNKDHKALAEIFITGMLNFFNSDEWKNIVKDITLIEPNRSIHEVGAFNTSLPKMFDNLIVAFVKLHNVDKKKRNSFMKVVNEVLKK